MTYGNCAGYIGRRLLVLFVVVVLIASTACMSGGEDADSTPTTTTVARGGATPVAPAGPRVAPELARDGYDRDRFGGYDRDEVLAAHHGERPGCAGYWSAPDATCHADAGAVEVDHVVALAEAWDSGAADWPADRLEAFGSDPANLELLTAELNSSKQDDDAAEWLPPSPEAVCPYLEVYVSVKVAYDLAVDEAERATIDATGCG